MNYNNRMPVYREKNYPKRRVYHREVKDGRSVFVEGLAPNPYQDISCESLRLKSRIDSGTFENREGAARRLEKAQGSDLMTAEIEKQQRELEERKRQSEIEKQRKKAQEFLNFKKNDENV